MTSPAVAGAPLGQAEEPHRVLVPVLVCLGMVVAVVSSLGAPLIPTIAAVDRVSLADAQWSLTVTLLVGAIATPTMGRLGDGRTDVPSSSRPSSSSSSGACWQRCPWASPLSSPVARSRASAWGSRRWPWRPRATR